MKKSVIKFLSVILLSALPFAVSYSAESSLNVALTTNYVFRGQTQTNDGAAAQVTYSIQQSKADTGWYAGAFASTVQTGLEIDAMGGWRDTFGKDAVMGYDVGGILYKYTDSGFGSDTTELYAGMNYETAFLKLYIGNVSGGTNYNYLEGGADFVVLKDMDLNVRVGTYLSGATGMDAGATLSTEISGFNLGLSATYETVGANNEFEFFATVSKDFDI